MRNDRQIDRQIDRQTDRQTDMTKLKVAFRKFANAPINYTIFKTVTHTTYCHFCKWGP